MKSLRVVLLDNNKQQSVNNWHQISSLTHKELHKFKVAAEASSNKGGHSLISDALRVVTGAIICDCPKMACDS